MHNGIVGEKQWIIRQDNRSENLITDVDGKEIGTYGFEYGNSSYAFSRRKDKMLCYFYSAKSQLYDLADGSMETLWAHPTYLKGYKEIMYSDTHHNFGLSTAAFSPDDAYIVGGGDHGKYVAWTLPTLERVELIPQQEVIDLFKGEVSIMVNMESGNAQTVHSSKATLVEIEGQTFLNNRENEVADIIFLDNGDYFLLVTDAGITMVFDRQFKYVGYKATGVRGHAERYLSRWVENGIVIYKRV